MPTTLSAHEQPVSKIFSDDYVFNIPTYQRPYAWRSDQAQDLFDDLVGYMNARPGNVDDMPPYFLGSMVLIKSPNSPKADVVDGQQRLTTLTILLAAIRANTEKKNADDITHLLYERGSQIRGTQDRFRLSLRERDKEFFKKYVQLEAGFSELLTLDQPGSDSRRNIRDNARLLNERVKSLTNDKREELAKFIVTRCYLVAVATPDLDSAYRIFSVLNSRGLDLSATDIFKAEILGRIPEKSRESYTTKWEDCEDDLGREGFVDLFSHIRMIYRQAKPHSTLLKEFQEHVVAKTNPVTLIDEIILPIARVYSEITDANYSSSELAEEINLSLKWLNRLEFNDWVPPALAFAKEHRNTPAEMAQFFCDLERLAYGLLIMRSGINDRIDRFSKLTGAIENANNLYHDGSALQLTADEQYSIYSTLNGPIYSSLAARARTTIMLRIDSLVSGGGAIYDYSTITVEHVLPQNPPSGSIWEEWIPDKNIRDRLVHKLGNLALLTRKKNSAASNYEFKRKKEAYFTRGGISPFALTTQVLNHSDWTSTTIEHRQQNLISLLEKHWRLEGRKDSMLAELEITLE